MRSIVLFSGGMDSTTAAGLTCRSSKEVLLLTLRYGSLHQGAEARTAPMIAHDLQTKFEIPVVHRVVELPAHIFQGGASALMGDSAIPSSEYLDYEAVGPSPTVVPFRNANLISVATAIADKEGYQRVVVGVHASDHARWAYPDCTPEFMGAMANAVYVGTYHKVRLQFPLIWYTKAGVCEVGNTILGNYLLSKTWSCYRGGEIQCGTCPTCIERKQAFRLAEVKDLTRYADEEPWDPEEYIGTISEGDDDDLSD